MKYEIQVILTLEGDELKPIEETIALIRSIEGCKICRLEVGM